MIFAGKFSPEFWRRKCSPLTPRLIGLRLCVSQYRNQLFVAIINGRFRSRCGRSDSVNWNVDLYAFQPLRPLPPLPLQPVETLRGQRFDSLRRPRQIYGISIPERRRRDTPGRPSFSLVSFHFARVLLSRRSSAGRLCHLQICTDLNGTRRQTDVFPGETTASQSTPDPTSDSLQGGSK